MNIIWVSPDGQKYDPNINEDTLGNILSPVASLQDAMKKINNSSKVFWLIQVSPGYYSDPFTIPENKIICIVGAFRATMLGNCTWKIDGHLSSLVLFRDIGIDNLKIEDATSTPASLATLALENTSVNNIQQDGKGYLDIAVSGISAASDYFANTLGASSVIYGDVNVNNFILVNNVGFLGGKVIICNTIHLQNCLIEQDLYLKGEEVILKGTQWLSKNFIVRFINLTGKILLDPVSYNSFIKNKIKLINGTVEVL